MQRSVERLLKRLVFVFLAFFGAAVLQRVFLESFSFNSPRSATRDVCSGREPRRTACLGLRPHLAR